MTSLKKESYDLKGANHELVVTQGLPPGYSSGSPAPSGAASFPPWVNLCLIETAPSAYIGSGLAGLLLPPSGSLTLTEHEQDIFGLYNTKVELNSSPDKSCKLDNLYGLDGSTVYVSRWSDSCSDVPAPKGFNCRFVNVMFGCKLSCVLLENPQGRQLSSLDEAFKSLSKGKKMKIFSDKEKKKEVSIGSLSKLAGQTLYM